ncbi:MAG: hypothetical protein Q4C49_09315, partial [Bacillota bacterium]|nr:hypothetical protein [Bacillota bacterium]
NSWVYPCQDSKLPGLFLCSLSFIPAPSNRFWLDAGSFFLPSQEGFFYAFSGGIFFRLKYSFYLIEYQYYEICIKDNED